MYQRSLVHAEITERPSLKKKIIFFFEMEEVVGTLWRVQKKVLTKKKEKKKV